METISGIFSGLTIPFIVVVLIGVVFGVFRAVSRLYNKVPPNVVAVVYGRKKESVDSEGKKIERGYRVVKGGGFLRIPILEEVKELSLNTIPLTLDVSAPSKEKVLVKVKAIANVKILSDDASLALAIERFLGKDEDFIQDTAKKNLDGVLRGIVATLSVEDLIGDRQQFETNAVEIGNGSLRKLGLTIDLLTIQDVTDTEGYIESLGKKRTAEVVADAKIGEAEAKRRGDVQSATARREGEVATAQADTAISDAARVRDMQIADNSAKVGAQEARVPIAAQIAATEAGQTLKVANVAAEKAEAEAQIELQGVIKKRTEAELDATVVVTAEKEGQAAIIGAQKKGDAAVAEAEKRGDAAIAEAERTGKAAVIKATAKQDAASKEGEAGRVLAEKEAAGKLAAQTAEADGRMKLARAKQSEMTAEAEGEKAQGLAKADVIRANLTASADGEKAQGLANAEVVRADLIAKAEGHKAMLIGEAAGIEAKAAALAKLDQTGRLIMILEALPPVIASLGEVAKEIMVPMAGAIGQGLGNVKELRIIDMGGGNESGPDGNVLKQFVGMPAETIFGLIQKAKSLGLDKHFEPIVKKFGLEELFKNPTIEGVEAAQTTVGKAISS